MQQPAVITKASAQPVMPDRKVWLKNRRGDAVGGNFTIPKGDFSHFLGWNKPTAAEATGEKQVSGGRVLEVAIQKEFDRLGKKAVVNGMAYRNMVISSMRYNNKPGREKDMIRDGLDAIKSSVEMNGASNTLYLEMQYKFQMASKSFTTLSNLMKVRHESTKKAVSEIR